MLDLTQDISRLGEIFTHDAPPACAEDIDDDHSMLVRDPDLAKIIGNIVDEEESENFCLHLLRLDLDPDISRPLTIIVHPGDASGEPDIAESLEACIGGLHRAMAAGHRFLILHRFSSSYDGEYPEIASCEEWFDAVAEAGEMGDHVYSDQLDLFSVWFSQNYPRAEDAAIHVTGLWGDPEDGCAARIAETLAPLGAVLDASSPRIRGIDHMAELEKASRPG